MEGESRGADTGAGEREPVGGGPPLNLSALLSRLRRLAATRYFPTLLLIAIIGFAAWLRLSGNNWDDGQHIHPDERFLTLVETHIEVPSSLGEYFNSEQSPFNPYNRGEGSFVYGTFPLFFVRIVAEVLNKADYGNINLVGRFLAGLFDVGSVLLVFLVGRRLYGRNVGLLAAFLLTSAVGAGVFEATDRDAGRFVLLLSPLHLVQGLTRWFFDAPLESGSQLVQADLPGVMYAIAAAAIVCVTLALLLRRYGKIPA